MAAMTGGPKVMLGTKWPSMTSRCTQSMPARSMASISSLMREKSQLSMEGAMMMSLLMTFSG